MSVASDGRRVYKNLVDIDPGTPAVVDSKFVQSADLKQWLDGLRPKVLGASGTLAAIDYTLRRWAALTRYLDDGRFPIDNNPIENAIRPVALGRKNWLFAGSETAGRRAAAIMSLLATAKANGRDPHAWLTEVLTRLPTTRDRDIEHLLPHRWQPGG